MNKNLEELLVQFVTEYLEVSEEEVDMDQISDFIDKNKQQLKIAIVPLINDCEHESQVSGDGKYYECKHCLLKLN